MSNRKLKKEIEKNMSKTIEAATTVGADPSDNPLNRLKSPNSLSPLIPNKPTKPTKPTNHPNPFVADQHIPPIKNVTQGISNTPKPKI